MKKTINFFQNWNNKLSCDYFTTIRPDWDYYKKGEIYTIVLNKIFQYEGQILEIRRFYLKDLNQYMSFLDAGLSPELLRAQIVKMYPKKDFKVELLNILLIKKMKQ